VGGEQVALRPLLRAFGDENERCRETATATLAGLLRRGGKSQGCIELAVPVLAGRLMYDNGSLSKEAAVPVESGEEIRLGQVGLLRSLVELCQPIEAVRPQLAAIVTIICRVLGDPFHEVRKEACKLLMFLAAHHPEPLQLQAAGLIKSLLPSLGHQHAKVRIETLDALCAVSCSGKAPACLFDNKRLFDGMQTTVYDRAGAVRERLVLAVERWMQVRATVSGGDRKASSTLVHLLLVLVADEDSSVHTGAYDLLQRAASTYASTKKADKSEEGQAMAVAEADSMGDLQAALEAASGTREEGVGDGEEDEEMGVPRRPGLKSYPSPFGQQPPVEVMRLVAAHLDGVLPGVLAEVGEWTAKQRGRAARLLLTVLLLGEDRVVGHSDALLESLCRVRLDDDAYVACKVKECIEVVGHFVDPETYLPRTLPVIRSPGEKVTPTLLAGTVAVVTELLRASGTAVGPHIGEVAAALVAADTASMEDATCQSLFLELAEVAIVGAGSSCDAVSLPLCALAAGIQVSAEGTENAVRARGLEERLAEVCQHGDLAGLRLRHYPALVQQCCRHDPSWVHNSPPAKLFVLLVARSGPIVFAGPHGRATVELCLRCCHVQRDAKLRAMVLSMMADAYAAPEAGPHCDPIAPVVLERAVLPNCTWRAGIAAAMARSAAVRLLGAVVPLHREKGTYQALLGQGLIPVLLTAMEEEEAASRLLACHTLSAMFHLLQAEIGYEDTKRSIPEVLKRLDDSRDSVRLAALDTVTALVAVVQHQNCSTYYDYIVEAVLHYLEDSDLAMREKSFKTLQSYAELDKEKFAANVRKYLAKGTTSAGVQCRELLAGTGAL